MARLGPELRGKLPPGAEEDHKRQMQEFREANALGILKGVQILSGPGCPVSEAQEGQIYQLERVPNLPLPGCDRSPCCACCYTAVVDDPV